MCMVAQQTEKDVILTLQKYCIWLDEYISLVLTVQKFNVLQSRNLVVIAFNSLLPLFRFCSRSL